MTEEGRFEFGENWRNFIDSLNDERIITAERSLKDRLHIKDLNGKRFLDVGSGSGLFSLAARRLGATVHSFDYDSDSVKCTAELRRRYFPDDPLWKVEQGSILDPEYLKTLGSFDIVYSWGVLHHTGAMWSAFENIIPLVGKPGLLFIAIYNDQGLQSLLWRAIKRGYTLLPRFLRTAYVLPFAPLLWGPRAVKDLFDRRPFHSLRYYQSRRGMSAWHDLVDWVGGYPFEVATPRGLFDFFHSRGFELLEIVTVGGRLGCNELVFRRSTAHDSGTAQATS